jgi:hypothetical protein
LSCSLPKTHAMELSSFSMALTRMRFQCDA